MGRRVPAAAASRFSAAAASHPSSAARTVVRFSLPLPLPLPLPPKPIHTSLRLALFVPHVLAVISGHGAQRAEAHLVW